MLIWIELKKLDDSISIFADLFQNFENLGHMEVPAFTAAIKVHQRKII